MNRIRPAFLGDTSDSVSETSDRLVVQVYLGPRSYEIDIVSDQMPAVSAHLDACLERLPESSRRDPKALIVTDRNVHRPHAAVVARSLDDAGWNHRLFELEPGEQSKNLATVSAIYDRLVQLEAGRQTFVVAVGGGVVGDVAGFAAATYARGVPFVQVPTTLLAHVDSSVGGKVGVNHPRGKNLVGAFYQPLGVFIDTATLDTLPDADYTSGLAEVIKYGVILDENLFGYLEENVAGIRSREPDVLRHVIARCCRLKADIVETDETEQAGVRAVLNYGHTFAHAFEALTDYGGLLHGEAVAVGMLCASRLAERRGLVDQSVTGRQRNLIAALGLPTTLPDTVRLDRTAVLERMRLDKKAVAGRLRFVLPTRIGDVNLFSDVPESDLRAVLEEMLH